MYQLIVTVHVLIAIALVILVLIQHGKGADIGAAFGSGASSTVFGSQGTGSFLFRLTGGLALGFFITSVALSTMIAHQYNRAAQQAIPQSSAPAETSVPLPLD